MSKQQSQFEQIAAIAVGNSAIIFGLDGFGRVWKLIDGSQQWILMPAERWEERTDTRS
jgi:hypothetical protein